MLIQAGAKRNFKKLEVLIVASALDDMQAEGRLAVVSHSLLRRQTFVENQYGGRPHVVSYNIIIFVSKAGTLPYIMVFLNSTFQLQQFPRYQAVPNLHQGAPRPLDATQRKNFCTRSEYFTASNSLVFLKFLSSYSSFRDNRGSQIYIKGPVPPDAPSGKILTHPKYLPI